MRVEHNTYLDVECSVNTRAIRVHFIPRFYLNGDKKNVEIEKEIEKYYVENAIPDYIYLTAVDSTLLSIFVEQEMITNITKNGNVVFGKANEKKKENGKCKCLET